MIGTTVTIHDKTGKHCRQILSEYYQYSRRFYETKDLDTGEIIPVVADVYDQMFKTQPGKAIRRKKGETILHRQSVNR